jgi:hypothetical protein
MKVLGRIAAVLGLTVWFAYGLIRADEWDKTTKVTFNEAVQVPGTVLQKGTYVFRLADSQSNRHIVQIFNEDHTALITTIMAIPNYRLQPAGKTILQYDERPADQPMALAAWFYPGDNFGQEFVYPKSEAEQLSRLNKREVPSTGSEEAYPGKSEQSAANTNENAAAAKPSNETATENPPSPPAARPTPAPQAAPAPTPAPQALARTQTNPQPERLPQTASLLPLVGVLGLAFLGIAMLLRVAFRA